MRAPPGPAIVTALIGSLGLYIWMALRTGVVWLVPTLRILNRRDNPTGYWTTIGAAAFALASLVGFIAYEVTAVDGFFKA